MLGYLSVVICSAMLLIHENTGFVIVFIKQNRQRKLNSLKKQIFIYSSETNSIERKKGLLIHENNVNTFLTRRMEEEWISGTNKINKNYKKIKSFVSVLLNFNISEEAKFDTKKNTKYVLKMYEKLFKIGKFCVIW